MSGWFSGKKYKCLLGMWRGAQLHLKYKKYKLNYNEMPLVTIKRTNLNQWDSILQQQGSGETRILMSCWVHTGTTSIRLNLAIHENFKCINLSPRNFTCSIFILRIYLYYARWCEYPRIVTEALFITERERMQPKFFPTKDCLNKPWHTHTRNTEQPFQGVVELYTDFELLIMWVKGTKLSTYMHLLSNTWNNSESS